MGHYVISTPAEQQQMLSALGMSSMKDLFRDAPQELLLEQLEIPAGRSELEVRRAMEGLAAENSVFSSIFRGAGAYDHYIPAIVRQVTSKEEFVTAYTPYQAEISQGILQSIFEYQTMICELTGMDVSNASVYDGATAAAEAVIMCRSRKKNKALVSAALHPDTISTIQCYCHSAGVPVELIPVKEGRTDPEALSGLLTEDASCLLLSSPNYFGQWEDAAAFAEAAHQAGAKFILNVNPIALGLFQTPAELGADIAVGEGQPLGMPLAFGGPYLGFMAAKAELTRQLPGRIVGETLDVDGKRGYVLTLQAREQHIKREKASSSICSNQALCALTASVYLAAMGPEGLAEAARQCCSKAHYLAAALCRIPGVELVYSGEYFNEFVIRTPFCACGLEGFLAEHGVLSGLPLGNKQSLWCCTEKSSRAEMDRVAALVAQYAEEVAK
ncbi:MAG: aminomethyl-transferring glycine dehydrogenase subunit GcvPA [Bacillota bacterium]|nr:aminomethyl-transferring glycine dehydrogenase subunit GcvPA [Bacillota bacterium]